MLCSMALCCALCLCCHEVARCLRSTVHTQRSKSHGGCKNIGLVKTRAFMPQPNVSKAMQGFGDLSYCGRPVIMGCVVCSSAGKWWGSQFS